MLVFFFGFFFWGFFLLLFMAAFSVRFYGGDLSPQSGGKKMAALSFVFGRGRPRWVRHGKPYRVFLVHGLPCVSLLFVCFFFSLGFHWVAFDFSFLGILQNGWNGVFFY